MNDYIDVLYCRQRVREKFHGLSYLFEIINQIMISKSEPVAAADSGLFNKMKKLGCNRNVSKIKIGLSAKIRVE